MMEPRQLGQTSIEVSAIAMGCWPISGMTSMGVTVEDSLATLTTAVDEGVRFFDTAYCYGANGESERLIGQALGTRRGEIVIATKGGLHWKSGKMEHDGTPETLKLQCEKSLRRLQTDHVDLLYLHAPDPKVPIEESAGGLKELLESGKTRSVGLSNGTLLQTKAFHAVCPLSAIQPHYNMLQREIEADLVPWCVENGLSICVYWPLLKGLLAGKLARDHVFDPRDGRRKYPMFQGAEWVKNQDLVDDLRSIANDVGISLSALVLRWTIGQPGITSALCGAKRPDQIRENAQAQRIELSEEVRRRIDRALERRGPAVSKSAV